MQATFACLLVFHLQNQMSHLQKTHQRINQKQSFVYSFTLFTVIWAQCWFVLVCHLHQNQASLQFHSLALIVSFILLFLSLQTKQQRCKQMIYLLNSLYFQTLFHNQCAFDYARDPNTPVGFHSLLKSGSLLIQTTDDCLMTSSYSKGQESLQEGLQLTSVLFSHAACLIIQYDLLI